MEKLPNTRERPDANAPSSNVERQRQALGAFRRGRRNEAWQIFLLSLPIAVVALLSAKTSIAMLSAAAGCLVSAGFGYAGGAPGRAMPVAIVVSALPVVSGLVARFVPVFGFALLVGGTAAALVLWMRYARASNSPSAVFAGGAIVVVAFGTTAWL